MEWWQNNPWWKRQTNENDEGLTLYDLIELAESNKNITIYIEDKGRIGLKELYGGFEFWKHYEFRNGKYYQVKF